MRKGFLAGLLVLVTLMSIGCGTKTASDYYVRPDVELGFIKRIAVLPFQNNSSDEFAAERLREVVITQVMSMGIFDVVDKGIVDSVLREEAVEPGTPIDKLTLKRLGQRLNVQAFMLGSVDQAGENRRGSFSYPELSLALRLVEAKTGMVLWRASGHGSGYSTWGRLFGLAPEDSYQVGVGVVKEMLSSIPAGEQL